MGRILKYLFGIAVLGLIGLVGYAMIADLPPPMREVVVDLSAPEGGRE